MADPAPARGSSKAAAAAGDACDACGQSTISWSAWAASIVFTREFAAGVATATALSTVVSLYRSRRRRDAAKKERYVWGPYPAGLPPSISVAALRARESGSVPLIHPKEPPRLVLTQTPTPVQAITRVPSVAESKVNLAFKLDSLTDTLMSGNKVRKLEYLLHDAISQGCTAVITCGGFQSNHCRSTVAAARRAGLEPHLLLRSADRMELSGNLLLDTALGAHIRWCTPDEYSGQRQAVMREMRDDLGVDGETAYIIPEGGSNALGAWGYIRMVWEEIQEDGSFPYDTVAVAVGSGGTVAGLVIARALFELDFEIIGFAVCDSQAYFESVVANIVIEFNAAYNTNVSAAGYEIVDDYMGPGYGVAYPAEIEAMDELARTEGILLEPSYGGKAYLGVLRSIADGRILPGSNVLFVHTGGIFGLLSRADLFPGAIPGADGQSPAKGFH